MEKELASIVNEEIDEEEINKLDDAANIEKSVFVLFALMY